MRSIVCIILSIVLISNAQNKWDALDDILKKEVENGVTPGLAAAVVGPDGPLYVGVFGNLTYGLPPPQSGSTNPPVTRTTLYDMASMTKVLMTTTAFMQFYQRGELDLHTRVSDPKLLGPDFAQNGKQTITVLNLLLHNSGFPPDPDPFYSETQFGCPESNNYYAREVFTCQRLIYKSLMEQTLIHPVGSTYVYSDLNFITGMYVVGHLARTLNKVNKSDLLEACIAGLSSDEAPIDQCYYEAYIRKYVIDAVGLQNTGFLPPKSKWGNTAPTWIDANYRHFLCQGQVSDQNSYALGGISGHAGLFTDIQDTISLTSKFMWAPESSPYVNKTTFKYFSTIYNETQSSRALGWDTNNYVKNTYRGCSTLSSSTWTHTGYTGTEVCGDPVRQIVTITLTNRCYPYQLNNAGTIRTLRQTFNNAVRTIYDSKN